MSNVLENINEPTDIHNLSVDELRQLGVDIRELIISTVSRNGGHLAANLGVVELTIALLRVFDPGQDKILWDVSHQSYTYKILTGRRDRFHTLRQHGGISGFLKRDESPYDVFGAGHAGTALSAALGMAVARDRRGGGEHVVAVLGDGAAGCGIALEALNHVHGTTQRLIMILNDNEMSIGANVGSIARLLGRLLASPKYNRWKYALEQTGTRMGMSWLRAIYYRLEELVKGLFVRSVIFEELGFRYIGPIDGHNMKELTDALTIAREYERPIVVHVATQKGRGYSFAEESPEKWHGTHGFDVDTGVPLAAGANPGYSDVFGQIIVRLGRTDPRIVAITAAMARGTGLSAFAKEFPTRFFDVGMSEEHAVVFAAGMSTEGLVPVFAVYSTFLQRAVDCIIHDVCLQNLPVVFCLDRAGIVGEDGPTHHGIFDIPLLRSIPNLVFMQPKDEPELAAMLLTAVERGGPVAIRYPRGSGPGRRIPKDLRAIPVGRAEVVREPAVAVAAVPLVWFWALGDMVPLADAAVDRLDRKGVRGGVVNARFIRPLDSELLLKHARDARVIVTLENGVVNGGFGSGVVDVLLSNRYGGRILRYGWPDAVIPHGDHAALMVEFGLTVDAIVTAVMKEL